MRSRATTNTENWLHWFDTFKYTSGSGTSSLSAEKRLKERMIWRMLRAKMETQRKIERAWIVSGDIPFVGKSFSLP